MDVAVLGGGHGSYAAAANLTENGHQVRFWRRDKDALQPLIENRSIRVIDYKGERKVPLNLITNSLDKAIKGAEVIVIPLPSTSHNQLSLELCPILEQGQIVYLPPGTFGSYLFATTQHKVGNLNSVTYAETGTLPYLARKHGHDLVAISGYATRLPTGIFPACNSERALSKLSKVYPIEPCEDVLSAALMNAGPIIHPPLILMNAGPLEHFEQWDIHNEGTQPAIRRVTDALDSERISIRESLGYSAPHFPLRDHYDKSSEGEEWMYGRAAHEKLTNSGDWRENINFSDHRYMLEDCRLGLSFIVSVGRWAGVKTPVAQGLLNIASAINGNDFYSDGRTLESFSLHALSREKMQALLWKGFT